MKRVAMKKVAVEGIDADAVEIEKSRDVLLKATVHEGRRASHALHHPDEAERYFTNAGAIDPPYNPFTLLTLLEHSNALRQCIDSYVTNIDATGHRFEAVIDLEASDSDDRLKTYIMSRRAAQRPEAIVSPTLQLDEPSEEEIDMARAELKERMRVEKTHLEHFFEYACLDISFSTLRRRTRQDLEQEGNAYWEVIRSEDGKLAGFEYIPAYTMRHMRQHSEVVNYSYRTKVNEFDYQTSSAKKRFRTFLQCFESRMIFFKEFGDPRCVDALTGSVYKDFETMRAADKNAIRASEVIHFRVHTAKSSYGIPRWVGTLLSVLGSRHAEEVNLAYFENKSVPPLVITVQGGRMSSGSVDRIRSFVDNELKGKKNFHKILILEADGQGGPSLDQGRMKIDVKPLTAAQHNDALFQNYDERNIDKVGQAFRLPRMLRGDIRDFNRATAEAAVDFTENQVFKPERDEFDFTMNRKILPVLGIRFWRFRSNSAATPNARDTAEIAAKLGEVGFLTPAEGRDIAEGIFNRQLQKIDAPWVRQPLELTVAGVAPKGEITAPGMVSPQTAATGEAPAGAAPLAPATQGFPVATTSAGTELKLTGTDLAAIITVNEARDSAGLPTLKLPDGKEDPEGYLTVTEFKAKRQAAGATTGEVDGAREAGVAPEQKAQKPGDLVQFASQLLGLRKAMTMLEVAEARAAFEAGKMAAEAFASEDQNTV